ncbi:hypothetical protein P7C73_g598, partial [Tremellales sp. Uapishka_1]
MAEQRARAQPLRQSFSNHNQTSGRRHVSQSRRQSADTDSQPPSPITFFALPSTFTSAPQSISMGSPSGSRPPSSEPSDDEDESGRTPTMGMVNIDSAGSSPRLGTGRTGRRRQSTNTRSHASRPLLTPMGGYGATHNINDRLTAGLGLGAAGDILSPRRVSTAAGIPIPPHTAYPLRRSQSPSRSSLLSFPSHSAYLASHSQPGTAIGLGHSRSQSSQQSPRRLISSGSPLRSPTSLVFRKLRATASMVGLAVGTEEYDGGESDGRDDRDEEDEEPRGEEGKKANGTRVWYSSYVTIDWIHDAIKDSSRIRRLRHHAKRSYRGSLINAYDRFQGWLIVTLVGVFTALIAYLIIRSEMALFDLKEGFCSSSWGTAKRFCCLPHHPKSKIPDSGEEEACGDWVEWGELFAPEDDSRWIFGGPEFVSYAVVALGLATLASALTIYLSSSAHHSTSKDSLLLHPSPIMQDHTSPRRPKGYGERQALLEHTSGGSSFVESLVEAEPPRKVMYFAAGSGIPEIKTILSGFVIHGYLGGWTLLTKSIGLALSVASGLSLGKEGPFVHIASCVGNIVSRGFRKYETNEAKRREILSAACAAGVAVSFGAPIGGVLFSLEEVSYYFPPKVLWRSFWCAAVAAMTLKWTNPFGNGSIVLGLYGAVFSRLNSIWSRRVRNGTWVKRHPIIEVFLVTAFTTALSFMNPYARMGGTELVANLFAECKPDSYNPLCAEQPDKIAQVIYSILVTLLVKGGLTIITFGIKLPAGIFIPSMAVGACFGRVVGLCMEYVEFKNPDLSIFDVCKDEDCILPGLYAMVGAAATLAGVTRTTVSLAVIMFELTGTLNYVVPVMIGVLVAKTVADGLEKKGIYDLVIEMNQLPYLDGKAEYLWGGHRLSEVADREVPTLRADATHTVRELTGRLLELVRLGLGDTGFPIVVKEQTMGSDGKKYHCLRTIGFLGVNELEHSLSMLSDEPDAVMNLLPEEATPHGLGVGIGIRNRPSVASIFSFADSFSDPRKNPYDLTRYMDTAPVTVQLLSSLELVHRLFLNLGARQIFVVDNQGVYKGVVYKKAWLKFLNELEEDNQ